MPRRKQTAPQRKPLGPGSRVAVLARDSGGNNQEKSVRDQVTDIIARARKEGWVIVAWFIEEAKPGGSVEHRDAFQEMLTECHKKPAPFDAVVVWDLARFGRGDQLDSQFYKAAIRRLGIEVVSISESSLIPEGVFGPLIEAVIDLKNNLFLADLSRNVKRGLRANTGRGYAHGGRPPWGLMRQPEVIGTHRDGTPRMASKWVPDPAEAPRVAQAFRLRAQGASYREIGEAVGVEKSDASWAAIFRNETYIGTLKCGDERYPDAIPAIVDADTWQRVQERNMNDRERIRESEFLLSGMLVCGHCQHPMAGGTDQRNARRPEGHGHGQAWRHYRCTNKACTHRTRQAAAQLEQRVRQVVCEQVLTLPNLRALVAELQARLAAPNIDEEIADKTAQIGATKRAISNLLDAIERFGTDEERERRYQQRQAELARLEADREVLTMRKQTAVTPIDDERLATIAERLRAKINSPYTDEARSALRAFVVRIELINEQFRLEYDPELLVQGYIPMPPRGRKANPCITAAVRS